MTDSRDDGRSSGPPHNPRDPVDPRGLRDARDTFDGHDDPLVDELAAMLRGAEPAPLSDRDTEDMLARVTRRAPRPRVVRPMLAMAAAVLLAVGGGWALRDASLGAPARGASTNIAAGASALHATLPTGDRVAATPGADMRLVSLSQAERRIDVNRGEVLFDVRPLAADERFEVHTPDAIVRVRGTVFSVRSERGRSEVRVYEGRVDVERRDGTHEQLRAGEMLSSDARAPRAATPAALDVDGRTAAQRRTVAARVAAREAADAREAAARRVALAQQNDSAQNANAQNASAQSANAQSANVQNANAQNANAQNANAQNTTAQNTTAQDTTAQNTTAQNTTARNSRVTDGARGATDGTARTPALTQSATRALLAAGDFQSALDAARAGAASSGSPAPWWLLEADALRGLGRAEEAATTYDRAAAALPTSEAAQAGFAAASLRFGTLGDAVGALQSLDAAHADGPGAPLDERALALRARALYRIGRLDDARRTARDYLARHPAGGLASWMQQVIDAPASDAPTSEAPSGPR